MQNLVMPHFLRIGIDLRTGIETFGADCGLHFQSLQISKLKLKGYLIKTKLKRHILGNYY